MTEAIYPNVEEMPDEVLDAVILLAALLIKEGKADEMIEARYELAKHERDRRNREQCGAMADWGVCRLATGHPDQHQYT